MVNKANPAVSIVLDKERHLLLDLNAMVAFEEATGDNLFEDKVAKKLATSMSPKDLRALLWACLIHEDDTLTLKQVGSWLRSDNMAEVAEKLIAAWGAAMPEGGKEDAAPLVQKSQTG